MVLVEKWMPPSRENWELIMWSWQFFPLLTAAQWITDYQPMGKSSIVSRFNLPGKFAWFTMEVPSLLVISYIMYTLPEELGLSSLPNENWLMASLYVIHYIYRAVLAPLILNPTMSPIHAFPWVSAIFWQVMNAISLGGWLAGYGPVTKAEWHGHYAWIQIGLVIWTLGFASNIWHDDELREIRRAALRAQKREAEKTGEPIKGVEKVYQMPENGLFKIILFPHYFSEWIEWAGYWMIGGGACVPARSFMLNDISTMLPRAVHGKKWYINKFGKEKVGSRKAVVPGII